MPYKNCLSVYLPECPVQKSVYGYYPSLAANTIFLVLFMLSALTFLIQGWIKRRADMNFFCGVMTFGTFMEGIGTHLVIPRLPFAGVNFRTSALFSRPINIWFLILILLCLPNRLHWTNATSPKSLRRFRIQTTNRAPYHMSCTLD